MTSGDARREARAFYEAIWHNPNRRQYAFRINNDGTFRIEDVIAGKYTLTVYLEKEPGDPGPPEEDLGGYHGTIEVPPIPGPRSDEPLDLGDLVLRMHEPPLKAGEAAPLFEAKTVDGKDIRLADYRGKFVLLSFWSPIFHPELDRLKELDKTFGVAGKLAIIDLAAGTRLRKSAATSTSTRSIGRWCTSERSGSTTLPGSTVILPPRTSCSWTPKARSSRPGFVARS